MIKVNNRWLYCGLSFFVLALLFTGGDAANARMDTIHEDLSVCFSKLHLDSGNTDLNNKGPLADLDDIDSFGLEELLSENALDLFDCSGIDPIDTSLPVVTLLGVTGAGKSSLGNMLARIGIPDAAELFRTNGGMESCTVEAKSAAITDFADRSMIVIDTPGLADTKGRDEEFRKKVAEFLLKHKIMQESFGVNTFVMVLNGYKPRLDTQDKETIVYYARMFGADFLDNLVFVIRSWPYAQSDIRVIERSCDKPGKKRPYGEKGKLTVSNDIKEMVYDTFVKAAKKRLTISQARLEKIRVEGIPCFYIDSLWDMKSLNGKRYLLKEAERPPAKAEVERLLNHIQNSPKYPCLPSAVNPNVQSEMTIMEEEKALQEEMLEKATQEKERIAEELEAEVEGHEKKTAESQAAADEELANNKADNKKELETQEKALEDAKQDTRNSEEQQRQQKEAAAKLSRENKEKELQVAREEKAEALLAWGKQMKTGGIWGLCFSPICGWSGVTGGVYLARGIKMIALAEKVRTGAVALKDVDAEINKFW